MNRNLTFSISAKEITEIIKFWKEPNKSGTLLKEVTETVLKGKKEDFQECYFLDSRWKYSEISWLITE